MSKDSLDFAEGNPREMRIEQKRFWRQREMICILPNIVSRRRLVLEKISPVI